MESTPDNRTSTFAEVSTALKPHFPLKETDAEDAFMRRRRTLVDVCLACPASGNYAEPMNPDVR